VLTFTFKREQRKDAGRAGHQLGNGAEGFEWKTVPLASNLTADVV